MSGAVKLQPKNDVKFGSNCLICEDDKIQGDVTIGNGTIIHPRACIIAESGPIVIGEHNLIEEKTVIINKGREGQVMTIGNYNVFEVGSRSESMKVGDYNVLEAKSVVGGQVTITNNCVIGAGCVVTYPGVLPENSAFYGPDCTLRIVNLRKGHQTQVSQMEFLLKVLPNYTFSLRKKKLTAKNQNQPS